MNIYCFVNNTLLLRCNEILFQQTAINGVVTSLLQAVQSFNLARLRSLDGQRVYLPILLPAHIKARQTNAKACELVMYFGGAVLGRSEGRDGSLFFGCILRKSSWGWFLLIAFLSF